MAKARRARSRLRLPRLARASRATTRPQTLFTRPGASPNRMLLQRVAIVVALCVLAFVVLYLDRDGQRASSTRGATPSPSRAPPEPDSPSPQSDLWPP